MMRRNIKTCSSIAVLILTIASQKSEAASIDFEYSFNGSYALSTTVGTTYQGIAYDAALISSQDSALGTITDTIHYVSGNPIGGDSYDGYGYLFGRPNHSSSQFYASPFNGLSGARYTSAVATGEAHAPLGFRWFDSFTNNTGQEISAIIRFHGNLGSDHVDTTLDHASPGYVIMSDSRTSGVRDETIVQIYSDANYAGNVAVYARTGDDEVHFDYTVNVAPGQTASILVFNYLVVDPNRVTDGVAATQREIELGKTLATNFINSPYLTGLTADQIASIINFSVKLDGSLPSPSAGSRIAGSTINLFNNLMDVNQGFNSAGAQLINDNISPMAYLPVSNGNSSSDGAAQIASLISGSGGKLSSGNDQHEIYMLGGYMRGSDRSLDETMKYHGFALGLGYEFSMDPSSRFGLVAGYMNSSAKIDDSYHDISGEQFLISPYAQWTLDGGIALDARASLSADNWGYDRRAGALDANAAFDGYSMGASLKASNPFETAGVTLTPFAKLSFLQSHFNAYQESGAGLGNLDVPSYRVNTFEAIAGFSLSDS
jgi:hypothetical protein